MDHELLAGKRLLNVAAHLLASCADGTAAGALGHWFEVRLVCQAEPDTPLEERSEIDAEIGKICAVDECDLEAEYNSCISSLS